MSSLTDTAQGAQPMNLHSRVIQSGLDSITGPDANSIVLLFTGCALFAEVRSYKSYNKRLSYDFLVGAKGSSHSSSCLEHCVVKYQIFPLALVRDQIEELGDYALASKYSPRLNTTGT